MPESNPSKKPVKAAKPEKSRNPARSGNPAKAAEAAEAAKPKIAKPDTGNPRWLVPTMLTLMLAGLAWIVLFYLSGSKQLPVPALESWNLAVGFGLIVVGFGMTTQWK